MKDREGIANVQKQCVRPRFSVMIPTYESSDTLLFALRSVLDQGLPKEQMQIGIVDDCSQFSDVLAIVRKVDPHLSRIEYFPGESRVGLGANWNRSIRLSRGKLIHLLHQDDFVLPGFYKRMQYAFDTVPDLGMAFCRSRIVDGGGVRVKETSREQWCTGVISNWLQRIAIRQRIQTPSVVVARSTYEALGGYRESLHFALDWEMWVRIAAAYKVWYDVNALAVYRRHAGNETSRLEKQGKTWSDLVDAIAINATHFPESKRRQVLNKSLKWHAHSAIRSVHRLLKKGLVDEARQGLRSAHQFVDEMNICPYTTKIKLRQLARCFSVIDRKIA